MLTLVRKRAKYYVPVLQWLPRYERKNLAKDVTAAVTVSLLMVPQSISYSLSLCHLPAIYGLYTAFFALCIYGLLGSSRQTSVGYIATKLIYIIWICRPEALICLLIGNAVQTFATDDRDKVAVAVTLALMSGILTLALGLARLGFLDSVLSQSLLRGFITAVASVIFIEQLPLLLGLPKDYAHGAIEESPLHKFILVCQSLYAAKWQAVGLSVGSIAFLAAWLQVKRHWKFAAIVPEILLLIVATSLLSYLLQLHEVVTIIGDSASETGFRASILPTLTITRVKNLLVPSIIISVLGFVEATVISKQFAQKYNYTVSPNRELVAFGVMNIIGSLLNAFPAYASMARSHLADSSHATTQLHSLLCGALVMITIWFLLPLFYYVPLAVMASIVCWAASGLLEMHDIRFWIKIGAWWPDLGMMVLSALVTICIGVEAGVLGSIAVSLLMVVRESTRVKMSVLVRVPVIDHKYTDATALPQHLNATSGNNSATGGGNTASVQDSVDPVKFKYKPLEEIYNNPGYWNFADSQMQDVLVIRIEEQLYFANTGQLADRLARAEAYGGWLHTHPSEEAQRVLTAASTSGLSRSQPVLMPNSASQQTNDDESSYVNSRGLQSLLGTSLMSQYPLRSKYLAATTINVNLDAHAAESGDDAASNYSFRQSVQADAEQEQLLQVQETPAPPIRNLDPNLRAIIFDVENMPSIDASALLHVTQLVKAYRARNISVCFVKVRDAVKRKFVVCGLLGEILPSECFHRKIHDAEAYLRILWQQPQQEHAARDPSSPTTDVRQNGGWSTYDIL